jgi:transcriptional regulator with GAF, ATPase, and Fis domain
MVINESIGLNKIVGDYVELRSNSSAMARCNRLVKKDDSMQNYLDLIEATSYRHRVLGEIQPYLDAIKTIAIGNPISDIQKRLIKDYHIFGHRELRGKSPWIKEVKTLCERVGKEGNCKVVITGETGTGKETIATLIHRFSPRCDDAFVPFNCADLSPQLLESRLFGHEKGAFTGADKTRKGAFELADGGTLFLDEVGELSLEAQAGLLRILQDGRFTRLGAEEERKVDTRIIAATHRNLSEMVKEGTFREDLFYRLNTIHIHVPPLRERPEDLAEIADNFLFSKYRIHIDTNQLKYLLDYSWPGNIRELENILERSHVLGETIFKN